MKHSKPTKGIAGIDGLKLEQTTEYLKLIGLTFGGIAK